MRFKFIDKLMTDTQQESTDVNKHLMYGAFIWAIYSILQVAWNGIIIDESVIAAQVITGAVKYPPGHPHGMYYQGIYSLIHYLAAVVWWLKPSPLIISAIQNSVYLFLSTMAAYAMTLVLTRRAFWGYVATVIVLFESYRRFQGVYPLSVFPQIYSNGHLGLQIGVLIAALLLNRMWKISGLLLGLFPSLHAIHALLLWFWSAIYLWFERSIYNRSLIKNMLIFFTIGLIISGGLALIIVLMAPDSAAVFPYNGEGNGALIREQFILRTDAHRRALPLFSFAYMVNPAAFFCLGAVVWYRSKYQHNEKNNPDLPGMVAWIMFLGAIVWVYIYGTSILSKSGVALPDLVIISMPGRFSNLTAVLLVPITIAGMSATLKSIQRPMNLIGLGFLGVLILGTAIFSASEVFTYEEMIRYEVSRNFLFLIWGIFFGFEFFAGFRDSIHRVVTILAFTIIGGMLSLFLDTTYVALYFVLLTFATWATLQLSRILAKTLNAREYIVKIIEILLVIGLSLSAAVALPDRDRFRLEPGYIRWDMLSDYDQKLKEWLKVNASRDELILAYIGPLPRTEAQAKLTQPVLLELKTLWIMSYKPDMSAVIGMMVRDLYGVDYSKPEKLKALFKSEKVSVWSPVWKKIWKDRTRNEWLALGKRYNFRLVISLTSVPLNLPAKLKGPRWTLYTIE